MRLLAIFVLIICATFSFGQTDKNSKTDNTKPFVLGVIDEKLLTFNADEISELLRASKIAESLIKKAGKKSFGRISHLKQFIERAAKQVRNKQKVMT